MNDMAFVGTPCKILVIPSNLALSMSAAAFADADKNESGTGRKHRGAWEARVESGFVDDTQLRRDDRRARDYEDERWDRHDELKRQRHRRSPTTEWEARGTSETRRGRVDVRDGGGDRHYRQPKPLRHPRHYPPPSPPPAYEAPQLKVSPGHLPPPGKCKVWAPGKCKVWAPGVPPGHQPSPTDCRTAEYQAARYRGIVFYGGPRR
jgi:hypothetical protein